MVITNKINKHTEWIHVEKVIFIHSYLQWGFECTIIAIKQSFQPILGTTPTHNLIRENSAIKRSEKKRTITKKKSRTIFL